jgi:LytTr DNA-binding domain
MQTEDCREESNEGGFDIPTGSYEAKLMKNYSISPPSANTDSARMQSDGSDLAALMVLQQVVARGPSLPAGTNDRNTIAPFDGRSNSSLASAAETKLPESLKTVERDDASALGLLRQLELLAKRQPPRIAVKAKGRIFFFDIADIVAVHAEGNYALLEYRSGRFLLRECLCSIAAKLKPHGFLRIHRSFLINASLVDEVWPVSTGEYRLRVRNGKEYVVTRRYKENLRHLAHVWLGSERFC